MTIANLRSKNWLLLSLLAIAFKGTSIVAAPLESGAPDMKAVAANGSATIERLIRDNASWTTIFETTTPGVIVHVAITRSPNMRHIVVDVIEGNTKSEVVRIIERDNLWYVSEGAQLGKYPPYEAPLMLPVVYSYISRADFNVIVEEIDVGEFEFLNKNIARYRVELSDATRNQFRQILQAVESSANSTDQTDQIGPELLALVRDALEKGVVREIDTETGILVTTGGLNSRRWVKDFRWISHGKENQFDVDDGKYVDHTGKKLERSKSSNDLALFSHIGGWSPGVPPGETDVTLVNIRSGEMGRVCFPFNNSVSGCFAKDRRSVFVTGAIPDEGSVGLFQVDLLTGGIRRLAADLSDAHIFNAVISPDGKTLASIGRTGNEADLVTSQVFLIDVENGEARKLGKPLDTGFLSWLPDAAGIVLITREYPDPNGPSIDKIARMDMAGNVTPIRSGKMPLVLYPYKRILFRDNEDQKWKVCDLNGNVIAVVGDGLKDFTTPAASPDGRQVIMMREGGSAGPRPHVIDLRTGTNTPIHVRSGFWSFPAWR